VIDANIALALLGNDRFCEAIQQARLAIAESPPDVGRTGEYPWLALIAAESGDGRDAEARATLQRFLGTSRNWTTMVKIDKLPLATANPRLLEGLRRAGMPEQDLRVR
jgi:hypothetical protein